MSVFLSFLLLCLVLLVFFILFLIFGWGWEGVGGWLRWRGGRVLLCVLSYFSLAHCLFEFINYFGFTSNFDISAITFSMKSDNRNPCRDINLYRKSDKIVHI